MISHMRISIRERQPRDLKTTTTNWVGTMSNSVPEVTRVWPVGHLYGEERERKEGMLSLDVFFFFKELADLSKGFGVEWEKQNNSGFHARWLKSVCIINWEKDVCSKEAEFGVIMDYPKGCDYEKKDDDIELEIRTIDIHG